MFRNQEPNVTRQRRQNCLIVYNSTSSNAQDDSVTEFDKLPVPRKDSHVKQEKTNAVHYKYLTGDPVYHFAIFGFKIQRTQIELLIKFLDKLLHKFCMDC